MLVKSAGWSIFGTLGAKALTLLTYVLVSRQVDPEVFGPLVFAMLLLDFFAVIGTGGARENYIRIERVNDVIKQGAFLYSLSVGVVMSILFVFLFILADFNGYFSGPSLVYWLLSPIPLLVSVCGFYQGVLERDGQFKKLAMRTIFISFVVGLCGVSLALLQYGVLSLVIARLAGPIVNLYILRKIVKFSPSYHFGWKSLGRIWEFGKSLILSSSLNFFSGRIFEFTAFFTFGPVGIAAVDVGRKIFITLTSVILAPLNPVSLSYISRSNQPRLLYFRFIDLVSSAVIPVFALISSFSDIIILFVFGEKWEGSSVYMVTFGFLIVPQLATWYVHNLFIRYSRPDRVVVLNIMNLLFLIVSFIVSLLLEFDLAHSMLCLVMTLYFSAVIKFFYISSALEVYFPKLLFGLVVNFIYFTTLFFVARYSFDFILNMSFEYVNLTSKFFMAIIHCLFLWVLTLPISLVCYRRLKRVL